MQFDCAAEGGAHLLVRFISTAKKEGGKRQLSPTLNLTVGEAGSMAAQNQPMIHAFGLMIFQWRKIGQGGRFRFVQGAFRQSLQGLPAGPIEGRRMRDLAKQAAPLDNHAVNISRAHQIGDPRVFVHRIFMD